MTRNFGFPQNTGGGGEDPGRGFAGGMGGGLPGPGRRVEHVQVYHLPSGKIRELRQVIETVRDAFNNFYTTSRIEASPPLDCSCIPEDMADIAECSNPECQAVVCRSVHSFTCLSDGKVYCTACGVADEYGFRICRKCWKKATTPRLVRWLKSLFWGEE